MSNEISFNELVQETTRLLCDYPALSGTASCKHVSLVLQRALIKSMPKVLTDHSLQSYEALFFSMVLFAGDTTGEIVNRFSVFWAGSLDAAAGFQKTLRQSIETGRLSSLVDIDANGGVRAKPDERWRFIAALAAADTLPQK